MTSRSIFLVCLDPPFNSKSKHDAKSKVRQGRRLTASPSGSTIIEGWRVPARSGAPELAATLLCGWLGVFSQP